MSTVASTFVEPIIGTNNSTFQPAFESANNSTQLEAQCTADMPAYIKAVQSAKCAAECSPVMPAYISAVFSTIIASIIDSYISTVN
jgi:hypothetical protein